MCMYRNPKPAALNQQHLRICYCHGACPDYRHPNWHRFFKILLMIPKCIPHLEAPRVQLIPEELNKFTEHLLDFCLSRIPGLGQRQEDYTVVRKAVTEAIDGIQRPRLVLDAQRDMIDRTVSRFHWVHLFDTTVVPSLTPSTAANQENPCIECRADELPFCICVP